MGWTHCPGPCPKWDSRLLLMRDFLGLFKPGCWLAQFGDVLLLFFIVSFLLSSVVQLCPNLCYPMDCSTPGFPVQHQLLELAQTHVHWVSDTIQPSYPLSSPSPAFNFSQHQGLFQWVSFGIRWPKYWSFSFSISSSSEYSGLISFRIDWFDLLAVQGTLKSLFPNTIVQKHQFFSAQLS